MAHQVLAEEGAGRVFHSFIKVVDVCFLRLHVYRDIGRDAGVAVVEPFDRAGVVQRRHADGPPLKVDLGAVSQLELGNFIHQSSKGAIHQQLCRPAVHERHRLDRGSIFPNVGLLRGSQDGGVGVRHEERAGHNTRNKHHGRQD